MNDFDDIIGDAVGHRADSAPLDRPDFGDVLGARQQRLRRRSVVGAVGVLAVGVTGMAAFAVGGPADSTADGPIGSDGPFQTTTVYSDPVATVLDANVWYCEGALIQYAPSPTTTVIAPATTITPATTVAAPVDSVLVDEVPVADGADLPPNEDSGYFRDCVMIEGDSGGPVDEDVTMTTYIEQYPTTTVIVAPGDDGGAGQLGGAYVVQAGDSPILVAEKFAVPLEDLLDYNGWSTASEFPFPGEEVRIPPLGRSFYEVQKGDSLIKIANDACVALDDVLEINGWTSGSELGMPGQIIELPAPVDGNCPDNGDS